MNDRLEAWISNVPQPLLALLIFVLLALAALVGNFARRYRDRPGGKHELKVEQEGYVVSAAAGLLALLLGFTFAMAIDRYDRRRVLVTEEANAISSSYLLAQTFEDPHRSGISAILVSYVDNRLALAKAREREHIAPLLEVSEAMQTRLWSAALAAVHGLRDDVSSNFLDSTREAIEVGERRVLARQAHIPMRVKLVLMIYMMITAGIMGYVFARSPKYISNGTLFVLLTLSSVLIIDLDRATSGSILESQLAMERLQARLRASPPSAFEMSVPDRGGGTPSKNSALPVPSTR